MARPKKQFCIHGHDTSLTGRDNHGNCISCLSNYHKSNKYILYQKQYQEQYILNHIDEIKEYKKLYYIENKDIINSERIDYHKQYYQENKEDIKLKTDIYRKENLEIYRIAALKQQENRCLRIPKFGQDNILEIYRNCPLNMTIDHVIPLQGEFVSGLHVRWNLQYLTFSANSKKNNKIDLNEASELYGQVLEEIGLK